MDNVTSMLSSLIIALYLPRAGNRIIEEFSRPRSTTTICREREISKGIFLLPSKRKKGKKYTDKIVILSFLPPYKTSRKSRESRYKFLKKALSLPWRFELARFSTVFRTFSRVPFPQQFFGWLNWTRGEGSC